MIPPNTNVFGFLQIITTYRDVHTDLTDSVLLFISLTLITATVARRL